MMSKTSQSPEKVRKVIGYLDFFFTTLLFFQVVVFTICPLVRKLDPNDGVKETIPKVDDDDDMGFEIWPLLIPPLGNHLKDNSGKWPYMLLGVFPVLTYIPWLAALSLAESSCPDLKPKVMLGWTNLWMKCNIGTIVFSTFGFIVVLQLHLLGYPVAVPIPTLLYIGFRVGSTVIISKQLDEMRLIVAALPEDDEDEREMRERAELECEEMLRALFNEPRLPDPVKLKEVFVP